MELPSTAHFIYIPIVVVIGLVLGFIWGSRATREQIMLAQRREDERAQKKAERAAAREKAARDVEAAPPAGEPSG